MLTTSHSPMRRTNLRQKFKEGRERAHPHLQVLDAHRHSEKVKTSEEPDVMLTKTKKKKYLKLHSNWHFRDLDCPYFKTERVLFTLPWRLFKDVYF